VKITPTLGSAALAGLFSAVAMPVLWARLADDSLWLTLAFLLVVAFPAHAFVVGIGQSQAPGPARVDTAMLKRVAVWFAASAAALAIGWVLRGQGAVPA
jgi:hypothetical protein